jgi:hypothetical protein
MCICIERRWAGYSAVLRSTRGLPRRSTVPPFHRPPVPPTPTCIVLTFTTAPFVYHNPFVLLHMYSRIHSRLSFFPFSVAYFPSFVCIHPSICTLAHAFIHPSFSQLVTASSHLNYLHWHPSLHIRFIPLTHIIGIFFSFSFHPIHCMVVS